MNFIDQLKNFIFWGWKLRNSVDFDCNSLYELIYLKLDTTYKCFIENSHLMWNRSEHTTGMKKLRVARNLAKRISEDEYINNHYRFVKNTDKLFDLEMLPKGLGKRVQDNRKRQNSQQKQEMELLFELLKKHTNRWWD